MTLGEKLRYLREVEGTIRGLDRELSQVEMARMIEKDLGKSISQSYLSQIESGSRPHLTNSTRMESDASNCEGWFLSVGSCGVTFTDSHWVPPIQVPWLASRGCSTTCAARFKVWLPSAPCAVARPSSHSRSEEH